MKKLFAMAFVAGMVAFASCTSKPAEESATDTTATMEATPDTTMTIDTTAADTTAADTIK